MISSFMPISYSSITKFTRKTASQTAPSVPIGMSGTNDRAKNSSDSRTVGT